MFDVFEVQRLTPSSPSATSSPPVTSPVCPTSTARAEVVADTVVGVSPVDVTMIEALESDWRAEGTTLSGGGAVVAAAAPPPPRGLAWRGGGAWACTICCSRGGGGVLCICCSGGGWRGEAAVVTVADMPPEGSGVCLMMILVTGAVLRAVLAGGGCGLMAPVRDRVVT